VLKPVNVGGCKIHSVYCNGDDMAPAKKITLNYRLMQSWETILAEINRYINPQNTATRLYVLLL